VKDFPEKGKPMLESLLKDQQMIAVRKLINKKQSLKKPLSTNKETAGLRINKIIL